MLNLIKLLVSGTAALKINSQEQALAHNTEQSLEDNTRWRPSRCEEPKCSLNKAVGVIGHKVCNIEEAGEGILAKVCEIQEYQQQFKPPCTIWYRTETDAANGADWQLYPYVFDPVWSAWIVLQAIFAIDFVNVGSLDALALDPAGDSNDAAVGIPANYLIPETDFEPFDQLNYLKN